jgi:transcriptional regulator with XRE-family HTH domain
MSASPWARERCEVCGNDLAQTKLGRMIRRHGYSYSEFAVAMNCSRPTIASWASNGHRPGGKYLRPLLKLLPELTENDLSHPFFKSGLARYHDHKDGKGHDDTPPPKRKSRRQ